MKSRKPNQFGSKLKALKELSEGDQVTFGQYLSQILVSSEQNAMTISKAFDDYLANQKRLSTDMRVELLEAYEDTFSRICEGSH